MDEELATNGRRYPLRQWRALCQFQDRESVLLIEEGKLECFDEAMTDTHKKESFNDIQEEMESLHENQTYELNELSKGKKALLNKWVYKLKLGESGNLSRYKAHIVVKGFKQKKGVDFDEIFAPVIKMTSMRIVLRIATNMNLEIEQLDVKTAVLNGDLEEEI